MQKWVQTSLWCWNERERAMPKSVSINLLLLPPENLFGAVASAVLHLVVVDLVPAGVVVVVVGRVELGRAALLHAYRSLKRRRRAYVRALYCTALLMAYLRYVSQYNVCDASYDY